MKKNHKHTVIFQPSGRRGYVDDGKSITEASRELGVDIESLCGGEATCGKCRVRIEEGFFDKYGVVSKIESISPTGDGDRKLLSKQQLRENYRLACQTHILGDVVIFVPEDSRKVQQVVRKEATARDIKLKPAVKKYYVELNQATLQDTLGDFERLQAELDKRFQLRELTIDYPVLLGLQSVVRQGDWKVTISVWKGKEIIRIGLNDLPDSEKRKVRDIYIRLLEENHFKVVEVVGLNVKAEILGSHPELKYLTDDQRSSASFPDNILRKGLKRKVMRTEKKEDKKLKKIALRIYWEKERDDEAIKSEWKKQIDENRMEAPRGQSSIEVPQGDNIHG